MDRRISPPVINSGKAGSSGGSNHSPLLASVRASSPPTLSIPAGMTQSSSSRATLLAREPSQSSSNATSLASPTGNGGTTGSSTFGDHKTGGGSSSSHTHAHAHGATSTSSSQRSPFSCPRHSYGDDPADLVVTIDKSEIRNDPLTNSQFSVFLITVRTCCVTWTIYRRYSEFEQLHKDLVRDHTGIKVPSLPPKKFLGSSLDAEFVNSRRQQLELYVRTLLHESTLFQSKILAVFIQGRKNDALGVLCDQYAEMKNRFIAMCAKVSRLEQQLREVDAIVKQADNAHLEMEQQKKDIRTLKRRVYELELERDARLLGGRDGDTGRGGGNNNANGVMAMDGTDRWLGLPGLPSSSTFPLPNSRGRRSASWYDYYLPFKPGEDQPYEQSATNGAASSASAYNDDRWTFSDNNGSGLPASGGGYHPHTRGVAVHAGGGGLGDFRSLSDMSDQFGSGASSSLTTGEYRKRAMSDRSYLAASIPSKTLHTDQLAARHFPYRTSSEPRTSPFDSHLNDLIEKRRGEKEAKADKKREKVSRLLSSASSPSISTSSSRETATGSTRSSGRDRDSSREGRTARGSSTTTAEDDAITIDGKTGMVYDGSDRNDKDSKSRTVSSASSAAAAAAASAGLTRPGTSPSNSAGGLSRLMELQRRKQFLKLRDEKMNNIRKEKASSSGTAGATTSASTGASMLMMRKGATSSGSAAAGSSASSTSGASDSKDDDKEKSGEAITGRTLSDTAPVPVPTSSSRGQSSGGSTVAGSMDTLDASSLSSTDASPNTHSLPTDLTHGTPSSPPVIATVSTSAPSKVPTRITSSTTTSLSASSSSSSLSSSSSSSIAVTMSPMPASVSSAASDVVGSLPSASSTGSPSDSDTTTTVLTTAPLQPVYEIDPRELQAMLESRLLDEELNDRVEDLIKFVKPTSASEARYTETLGFVETLIKKTLGAEVYPHGSFALKTYLPDADLDVSAFFSKGIASSWVQRLVTALCQEANSTSADPRFAVRSVTFVNADVRVVKCQIGRISVDISGNQMNALATLAFFEEIDKLVGKDHLFKRSILLSKTFFENESRIVGAHHGYLSSYCLRTLVLYIFNAYHLQIHTPLQALYMLLSYLEKFNWDEHALGLFGPIKLSALPKFEVVSRAPCSWPNGATPLITQQLFQAYSTVVPHPKRIQTDSNGNARVLEPKYLNVIDPANPFNNLGRSVSFQNSTRIRQAFAIGAAKFRVKLLKFVPAIYRPIDEPVASPAAASGSAPDVKKSTLVPTSAVFVPASESSLSSTSASSTSSSSSPAKSAASVRAPMSSGMAAALERERERERKSLREKERERERERERTGEDDPLDQNDDPPAPASAKDGEESEAHRIVTDLFQRTLFKYGGRMRYAFSPKPRPKPTPAVEPAALPSPLPAAAAAAAATIDSKSPTQLAITTAPGAPATTTTGASTDPAATAAAAAPSTPVPSTGGNGGDILNADLDHILHNLQHARQFEVPDISELDLVGLIEKVLAEHGSIPVGKMGSLLHTVINNHSLPAMLKERYGGLKKFLERHTEVFSIGDDHPFNPHVHLISSSGAIPNLPSSLYGPGISLPSSGTVSPAGSGPPSPHGSGSSGMSTPNRFSRGTVVSGPTSSSSSSSTMGHLSPPPNNGAISPPPQSQTSMNAGRATPPPHWTQSQVAVGAANMGGNMYASSSSHMSSVEPQQRRAPGPIGSAPGGGSSSSNSGSRGGPPGFGGNGAIAPPNAYQSHGYNGAAAGGSGARLPSSSASMVNDGYTTRGGGGNSMDAYARAEYEQSMINNGGGAPRGGGSGAIAPPGTAVANGGSRDRRRQRPTSGSGGGASGGRDGGSVGSGGIASAAASVGSVPNGPPAYYGPGVIGPHSKGLSASGYNAAALPFTPAGHVTHGQPSHQHTATSGSGYGHGMMSHLASHPRS